MAGVGLAHFKKICESKNQPAYYEGSYKVINLTWYLLQKFYEAQ